MRCLFPFSMVLKLDRWVVLAGLDVRLQANTRIQSHHRFQYSMTFHAKTRDLTAIKKDRESIESLGA